MWVGREMGGGWTGGVVLYGVEMGGGWGKKREAAKAASFLSLSLILCVFILQCHFYYIPVR